MTFLTSLIIFAVIVIISWAIYASLIKKRNKVSEATASIDVQLKKRYDLIPNILKIANKFMEHERSLLEDITKLRTEAISSNNLNTKLNIDNEIKNKMSQLMVAVENYPQLKSDTAMVKAMQTYNEVEEHIAAARRFHNSAVLELNNAVEIFPSSIFANILGIQKAEFFKAQEVEKQAIDASDYLK